MSDPYPFQHYFLSWYDLDNFKHFITTTNYYLGIFFNEKKINLLWIMILMQNILGFCDADEQCYKYNLGSLKIDFNIHKFSS